MAFSRRPNTNPKSYPDEWVKLIVKIRKRTNRGADHIWFMLRDKYAIYVSVSGINKVLKREGLLVLSLSNTSYSNRQWSRIHVETDASYHADSPLHAPVHTLNEHIVLMRKKYIVADLMLP